MHVYIHIYIYTYIYIYIYKVPSPQLSTVFVGSLEPTVVPCYCRHCCLVLLPSQTHPNTTLYMSVCVYDSPLICVQMIEYKPAHVFTALVHVSRALGKESEN